MKDPSRSSTSPSIISEDVIINGHSHEDDNPFAEYMWMENEEEFNRQASHSLLSVSRLSFVTSQLKGQSWGLTLTILWREEVLDQLSGAILGNRQVSLSLAVNADLL